ncbi:ATP-binding cassette sub-family C member 4-like, partial [Liolophura sinensis]|uniref:ATP-binding cassette sub-family C member 4-like n=1 Tax=Liolophura sinensis TaxID=3198878 RepID=UPI0031586775
MDETIRHHNPNPLLKANWVSKLFFWWLNPFFAKGYKRNLSTDDMYNVVPEDSSQQLCQRLESEWEKEIVKLRNGGKPSLVWALVRTFGKKYFLLGLIVLCEESTKVVQPLLLGGLIRYFTPSSTVSQRDAYLYAMGLSLCSITLAILHHPYFFGVQRIGMQIRVACCSLLYKKALRLSNKALGETTTGQIVNLMSNDVNRFDQACLFLHFLWVGPLQAIAVLIILWHELGPACLAGFGVLLLLIPVQGWMGRMFSKLRQKTAKFTDERVRLMNEIITGMRVIKMYCWEKPFGKLVQKVRRLEMKYIHTKLRCGSGLSVAMTFGGKSYFLAACLVVVFGLGRPVLAEWAFVCIRFFELLQLTFGKYIMSAIYWLAETKISVQRLLTFLSLEELEESASLKKSSNRPPPSECGVTISNFTAKWDKNVEQNTLED